MLWIWAIDWTLTDLCYVVLCSLFSCSFLLVTVFFLCQWNSSLLFYLVPHCSSDRINDFEGKWICAGKVPF